MSRSRVDRTLARLGRKTASGRYIPEVDGLRFVCIMLVLLFHVQVFLSVRAGDSPMHRPFGAAVPPEPRDLLSRVFAQGDVGVLLFFMISGFVLGLPFAAHRIRGAHAPSLRRYYLRRLSRLELPYVLALTLWFAVGLAMTDGLGDRYLSGLAYLHSLIFGSFNPINGPVWSLEIEVQFYVIVPLLAALFAFRSRVHRRSALLAAMLACIVGREILGNAGAPVGVTFLAFAEFFLLGFLLADVHVSSDRAPARSWRWDVAMVLAWVAIIWSEGADVLNAVLVPGGCALVFLAAFRGSTSSRVLANRWIRTTGGMAYSLYLLHYPLIMLTGKALGLGGAQWSGVDVLRTAAILIPVVLIAGVCFYALVERPCMEPDWPARARRRVSMLRRAST